jgi:hypothetical protein
MPIRFISVAIWQRLISTPSLVQEVPQHPAAREREREVQLVDTRSAAGTGRGREYTLPRLIPSALACFVIDSACVRSIIALRSAGWPC